MDFLVVLFKISATSTIPRSWFVQLKLQFFMCENTYWIQRYRVDPRSKISGLNGTVPAVARPFSCSTNYLHAHIIDRFTGPGRWRTSKRKYGSRPALLRLPRSTKFRSTRATALQCKRLAQRAAAPALVHRSARCQGRTARRQKTAQRTLRLKRAKRVRPSKDPHQRRR